MVLCLRIKAVLIYVLRLVEVQDVILKAMEYESGDYEYVRVKYLMEKFVP